MFGDNDFLTLFGASEICGVTPQREFPFAALESSIYHSLFSIFLTYSFIHIISRLKFCFLDSIYFQVEPTLCIEERQKTECTARK